MGEISTPQVKVKFVNIWRRFRSESENRHSLDTEVLKHGYRKGLETLVVHALNYEGSTSYSNLQYFYSISR